MNRRLGILLMIGGLLCGPLGSLCAASDIYTSQKVPTRWPVKPTKPAAPDNSFVAEEAEFDLDQELNSSDPSEGTCWLKFALPVESCTQCYALDEKPNVEGGFGAFVPRGPPRG